MFLGFFSRAESRQQAGDREYAKPSKDPRICRLCMFDAKSVNNVSMR